MTEECSVLDVLQAQGIDIQACGSGSSLNRSQYAVGGIGCAGHGIHCKGLVCDDGIGNLCKRAVADACGFVLLQYIDGGDLAVLNCDGYLDIAAVTGADALKGLRCCANATDQQRKHHQYN